MLKPLRPLNTVLLVSNFLKNPHPRICLLILEKEEGRGSEREKQNVSNINCLPPVHSPTGDRTSNLGKCPNQGLNPQPSGVWNDTPTN